MSENKQPFLWNFIQNTQHKYQTGAEEGSHSANEEMNSSITSFLTNAEEGLTASTNEETNAIIASMVSNGEELFSESVNEEVESNIISLHYDKKI